jgi:hypothetical protein
MKPEDFQDALANMRISVPRLKPMKLPEITPLPHFLSGEAAFKALRESVDELVRLAPPDHDVLIHAFCIAVREVRFIEPHILLFHGWNEQGHDSSVIVHFSQLIARVVYQPKAGPERVVTGFAPLEA